VLRPAEDAELVALEIEHRRERVRRLAQARVFCMKGWDRDRNLRPGEGGLRVTGGGNDDRPQVSLARGPITVLSADLRGAAMSIEWIIRRLLVYEGRRQPGTPRQGRPPGCPPGLRESDRQVGPPAVRVASEVDGPRCGFLPPGGIVSRHS
jgi:hypothetical protein